MRRLIERILRRFAPWLAGYGYTIQQREMVVFARYDDACNAGFRGQHHPKFPHLIAWWPGAGAAGLFHRPFQRVTVSNLALGLPVDGEGRLRDLLRSRMRVFGDDALWIEL